MKTEERHHLKQNEFAVRAAWVAEQLSTNLNRILTIIAGVLILGAIVGAFFYMQAQSRDKASAQLGAAMAVMQSPITPPSSIPGASQAAGTFPTEAARGEAAVAALQKVIDGYSNQETGTAARYYLGSTYLQLGRPADADKVFAEAVSKGGSSLYVDMARLGQVQALAAQQKYDEAIRILTDLSAQRDGKLPVDGVLMELARVCRKAGKAQEAKAAFKRVVDEFPESNYVGEARQQLSTMG